ncbi:MAG: aldo/keto reductase [Hyphomicrobiales bacterium]|nr:MAG: aldo/keto reductase [Hyphomicrobiales bacterium]
MNSARIVLGTAQLGRDGDAVAFALLDEYVGLGGTVLDTASAYHLFRPGIRSEEIIGEWLRARGRPPGLAIVSKGAHPLREARDVQRCDAASIRADIDLSLRRLGVEQIDLWYMHRDDPRLPVADIVGVLRELVGEGKIARFGCSNWTLPRLREALALPGQSFVANQVLGNLFCETMVPFDGPNNVALDAPTFRTTIDAGLTLDAYGGTADGYFEKRARGDAPPSSYDTPASAGVADRISAIAAREGLAPGHLALAFLLHLSPQIRALIGPRSPEQLRQSWPAGAIELTPELVREIAGAAEMHAYI